MLRSCLSLLLLVVHLATQVALAAHAHGSHDDARREDHNARPHVHLGWIGGSEHSHGHSHDHCQAGHATGSNGSATPQNSALSAVDCHDCDAVYLPTELGGPALKDRSEAGMLSVDLAALTVTADLCDSMQAAPRLSRQRSSGESTPASPRYLALRALRL